jgi:hypothetical protein
MTLRDQVLLASRQADQEVPSRLQTNRNVDCFEHTTRVLAILTGQGLQAAYVGKTSGEGQFHPPTGFPRQVGNYTITGVSHDAIWCEGHQFDLVGGGNDGPEPLGAVASPTANEIPAQYHRPNNPAVPFPLSGGAPPVLVPPSTRVDVPGRAELMDEGQWLERFYKAPEGLQRTEGLYKPTEQLVDWEGIAAWLLDVYLAQRLAGKSRTDARAAYVAAIQDSGEWKRKHPA